MKPFKKQINLNATKKHANEKNSTPAIQTFFKSAPKSFVVDKNTAVAEPNDGPKQFYVDILKEKLRRIRDEEYVAEDENGNQADELVVMEKENYSHVLPPEDQVVSEGAKGCTRCVQKYAEINYWEQKYKEEVEKRKELKKVYVNQTIHFSELYSKYNDLLKTATGTYHQSVDDAATSSEDNFTLNEVKFLQCMSLDKKSDCTFILHCLKNAYKCDPSVLVSKTLNGTVEWTQFTDKGEICHRAKDPLTPQKVKRIKELFIERISKCEIDAADYRERIKDSYVNKLFAAGIRNLSKKFK